MIKQPTVEVILNLAVHYSWPIKQLDVSNAFLHGVINGEVYMRQPIGYKDPDHPQFVCKLSKALYGLRQAPRAGTPSFLVFYFSKGLFKVKLILLYSLRPQQKVSLWS